MNVPYELGSKVFIVMDYNSFHDDGKQMFIIGDFKLKIAERCVEGYIYDEEGLHLAVNGWDGWNKLTTYHNISGTEDCKVFDDYEEALEYINKLKESVK